MQQKRYRSSSRIRYPKGERPRLELGGKTSEVVDLSATSLKCKLAPGVRLEPHAHYPVEIIFLSGVSVVTRAWLVRRLGDLCVLRLAGVLPKRALKEDLALISER